VIRQKASKRGREEGGWSTILGRGGKKKSCGFPAKKKVCVIVKRSTIDGRLEKKSGRKEYGWALAGKVATLCPIPARNATGTPEKKGGGTNSAN